MTVRETVLAALARVCAEKGLPPAVLSDRDVLGEGGLNLDSLDMATVVAELELSLHQDPFAASTPAFRTVGDLVALYGEGK
jgi:hypothetical protein